MRREKSKSELKFDELAEQYPEFWWDNMTTEGDEEGDEWYMAFLFEDLKHIPDGVKYAQCELVISFNEIGVRVFIYNEQEEWVDTEEIRHCDSVDDAINKTLEYLKQNELAF